MAELVVGLGHPEARIASSTGGKGAVLAKMYAAGLPVPEGFVVTTQAYRVGGSPIPESLARELAGADAGDMAALKCGLEICVSQGPAGHL